MKKDETIYLKHMRDAIERIEEYTHGMMREEFSKKMVVQDAVIRQIEILGEASKQVSAEFKANHSDIPWKDIAGMRDKLIHDYLGVDIEAVWITVERDLPALKKLLAFLSKQPGGK